MSIHISNTPASPHKPTQAPMGRFDKLLWSVAVKDCNRLAMNKFKPGNSFEERLLFTNECVEKQFEFLKSISEAP